jgi:hypothetical protein
VSDIALFVDDALLTMIENMDESDLSEWRETMSAHPPLIDNKHSGETPTFPS